MPDTGTKVFDYIYGLDLTNYYKAITDGYAQFLINTINDEHNLKIVISGIEHVPMNGQNRDNDLWCTVNIEGLPAIELSDLQPYATDSLTSCDRFISFYSRDMTPLKGVSYENWQDVYISFIIEHLASTLDLVNDAAYYVHDISEAYIESLSCKGGAIELLMNNISKEQCDKLNELLNSEDDI